MALDTIREERIKKMERLRQEGTDPYPADTARTHRITDALKKFAALVKSKKEIVIAGRVMTYTIAEIK